MAYNRVRQAAITQEITEVSSGAKAQSERSRAAAKGVQQGCEGKERKLRSRIRRKELKDGRNRREDARDEQKEDQNENRENYTGAWDLWWMWPLRMTDLPHIQDALVVDNHGRKMRNGGCPAYRPEMWCAALCWHSSEGPVQGYGS